jgi:hypothetical protein
VGCRTLILAEERAKVGRFVKKTDFSDKLLGEGQMSSALKQFWDVVLPASRLEYTVEELRRHLVERVDVIDSAVQEALEKATKREIPPEQLFSFPCVRSETFAFRRTALASLRDTLAENAKRKDLLDVGE